MKRFKVFVLAVAAMLVLLPWSVYAANTVEGGPGYIRVVLDGSTDFNWSTAAITTGVGSGSALATLFPDGLKLFAIDYLPPAVNAAAIIRNNSLTGPILPPKFKSATGDPQVRYYPGVRKYKPCIKNSEQTTPTDAEFTFQFEN